MLALILLLAQAVPQTAPDILVRARPSTEGLDACPARGCSTPEDARSAIARADALFKLGRYRDAHRVLLAALSRLRRDAERFPRSVAALYRADATVTLHLGDMNRYRSAVIGEARTLRENLPADDPQALLVPVRLGDHWLGQGRWRDAERQFEAAARNYRRRGERRLEALCLLRIASVDIALGDHAAARRRLDSVARSPVAAEPTVRLLGDVLRARSAAARGKDADVASLLATLRTEPSAAPLLIRSGELRDGSARPTRPSVERLDDLIRRSSPSGADSVSLQWADIGFMIGPDGRVSEVDVLDGSRPRHWVAPYAAEIAERRYAPFSLPAGHPGVYRIERYTSRSEYVVPTGSHVEQAVGPSAVKVLDITGRD